MKPMLGVKGVVATTTAPPTFGPDNKRYRLLDYIADPHYSLERKVDGDRVLIVVDHGHASVFGRDGQVSKHTGLMTDRHHLAAYAGLPDFVVLDGELVGGVFWIFDLPAIDGDGLHGELTDPFSTRRPRLESMFAMWSPSSSPSGVMFRLLRSERTERAKHELAIHCLRSGAEGWMAKHHDGIYHPGARSPQMIKLKVVHDADLEITAVGLDGHDNAELTAYDDDGRPVVVGRASLLGKGRIGIGDVVVVRYQRYSEVDRLVGPRIRRLRCDKRPSECSLDQLVSGTRA